MKKALRRIYEEKYKLLLFIPFLILLLAFVQLGVQYSMTGDFVHKGVSLKGGSSITFEYQPSLEPKQIEQALQKQFPLAEVSVRTLSSAGEIGAIIVDADAQEQQEIDAILKVLEKDFGIMKDQVSVEVMGAALGKSFFKQTAYSLLFAFILMGIVVLFYFRSLAPSLAVMLAAFSDIVVTLAIFNLTGIKLSTAGIAAFLMLIGYSVDTDILLSTRTLKQKEIPVLGRIYSAMKTGLTMSFTTLAAIVIGIFFVQSDVVKQIMIILCIGLLVDLIMTWIQNVGILRIYLERKQK